MHKACDRQLMWRGGDGVLHTVALPEPGELFTDAARAAIEQLLDGADSEDVSDLVERSQVAAYEYWDKRPVDEAGEAPFVASPPPIDIFNRVVASLRELETALAEVDPRWRLDVALALEDLVEAD